MEALQSFRGWAVLPSYAVAHPRRLESTLDAVDPIWELLRHLEVGCVTSVLEELAAFVFRVKVFKICVNYWQVLLSQTLEEGGASAWAKQRLLPLVDIKWFCSWLVKDGGRIKLKNFIVYIETKVSFISYMYIFCIVVKLATILSVLTLHCQRQCPTRTLILNMLQCTLWLWMHIRVLYT